MKRSVVKQLNPIKSRANAKIIDINGRYFLIGGMTLTKPTCDIYEFRLTNPEQQQFQVEWRPLKFENHLFTPRNSFSVCASDSKIYIWGGLQSNQSQMTQKCLSDLIEIDIACLFYDKNTHSLIAFGGTNQNSSLETALYSLQLEKEKGENEKFEWKKKIIKNLSKENILWQHSCNIYEKSLFTKKQGKFLLVVGGCRYSWAPYKQITQIDLNDLQRTQKIELKEAVVAHESIYDSSDQSVLIIGGANGSGFNPWIYKLKQGKIQQIEGHNAVGAACILTKHGLIAYGGVCGPQMLNDMILYHSS